MPSCCEIKNRDRSHFWKFPIIFAAWEQIASQLSVLIGLVLFLLALWTGFAPRIR